MPLPEYLGGEAADRENDILDFYLNYNDPAKSPGSFYDTDEAAAEAAVGAGGVGFSGARRGLLRRSQVLQNLGLATPILEARASRGAAHALQTQGEAAALQRAVQEGQQAMERLQLQERGLLTRQTQAEAARDRQLILDGQQAMERLQVSEQGQTLRQGNDISAARDRQNTTEYNANYRFNIGQTNAQNEAERNRSFQIGQNAADRNLRIGLGNQSSATTLAANRNRGFNDTATDNMLNEMRQRLSGGPSVPTVNQPSLLETSSFRNDTGNDFLGLGSPQGENEGTGEGAPLLAGNPITNDDLDWMNGEDIDYYAD